MTEQVYTTEKKEEVRILDNTGNVAVVYRIWATSKKGSYFHVDVPEKQLSKASAMLTEKAIQLDAI